MTSLVTASEVVRESGSGFRLEVPSLSIEAGEVVALIGENGAGKSTLARILAGIWRPDAGSVRWRGLNPNPTPAALARQVGYLQQSLPGAIGLTAEEVVELGRFVHRREDTAAATTAASKRALEMVGLEGFARRPIDRLSGGERKRALLAAVLAQHAPLLILDEPTAHLDPASHRRVAAAIREYVAAEPAGRAALVASHDLHFARAVADRVLGLSAGELIELGRRDEAFTVQRLAGLFATDFVAGAEGPPVVDLT